jgi:hypothetical protein
LTNEKRLCIGLIILVVVLVTASLFHTEFVYPASAETDKSLNIQVADLPNWASFASNVMFDATKVWEDANPGLKFYTVQSTNQADFKVQWVKEFGVEHVGFAFGNKFIEVGLGDSNCGKTWHPYSSSYISQIMAHEIGHVLGFGHDYDPNSIMFPTSLNKEYGLIELEFTLGERYHQFVPFCSFKETTTIAWEVSTNDPEDVVDVYLVSSSDVLQKSAKNKPFSYYQGDECSSKNLRISTGVCQGVNGRGGLLIITSDTLSDHLTKITIKQEEISPLPQPSIPSLEPVSEPNPSPTPTPTPTPTPIPPAPEVPSIPTTGSLSVEQENIKLKSRQTNLVKISGTVDEPQEGQEVTLVFTYPDGETHGNEIIITKDGYFETYLQLDSNAVDGTYEILGTYLGKIVDIAFFTVSRESEEDTSKPSDSIPSWIRNTASWWGNDQIRDKEFVQGLQYLINTGVINVSASSSQGNIPQEIPSWIKNNAKWWSEGLISDEEFVKGIEFLVTNGIITVY